ncbi:MAG: hypothetical protein HC853_00270 [Anaerolineae bacterium]|nr:hypothetical protein [Anaerolineae bacterium]
MHLSLKRLKVRLQRGVNLDSNVGVDGALGFVVTFPFWWMFFGLFFVLGYWFISLALNTAGIQKGTFYQGLGYNGKAIHNQIVVAGMGKWADDYVEHVDIKSDERTFVGQINQSVSQSAFSVPVSMTVKAGSLSRQEQFYPLPPAGSWE